MRKYDYGVKTLKANASANNSYGRVSFAASTTKTNDNQFQKLKNKGYYKYGRTRLLNRATTKHV